MQSIDATPSLVALGLGGGEAGLSLEIQMLVLVDLKVLLLLTGDSRSGAYAKMNPKNAAYDADYPVALRTGRNSVKWRLGEILAYVQSRPRVRAARHDGNAE